MEKLPNEMPRSLEAEQSILGCMLIDKDILAELLPQLKEDDFYIESHKYIYHAIVSLQSKSSEVDLVTLSDELEKDGKLSMVGGITYLTELTSITPFTANYKHYLNIVLRDSTHRNLIRGANDIIKEALSSGDMDSTVKFAEKTIFDVSEKSDSSSIVSAHEVTGGVVDFFDKITKDKNAYRGVSTGYKGLDRNLKGFHKTDLMILAARPAMGKTSLALNMLQNVALADKDRVVIIFSLEMSKEQLVQRMICSLANVSMEAALTGKLDNNQWLKLFSAKEAIDNSKILIDDSSLVTPAEILSKCRRIKRKYGRLDLVVIDYLQLMTSGRKGNDTNRQNEVAEISRSLKILAKEVDVPVLSLAQLSRANEQRTDKVPQLSDLRDSGSIEQDADIVMFIHRPDKVNGPEKEKAKPNVAEIIIAKHRNGPTGKVELLFKGECTKFVDLDSPEARGTEPLKVNQEEEELPNEEVFDDGYIPSDNDAPPEEELVQQTDDELDY